jgi:hypothetical protein
MDPTINKINELIHHIKTLNEQLEISDVIIDELLEEIGLEDVEELTEEKKENWIKGAIKKEGSLRKTMKAKKGKNIPEKKLEAASHKSGKTGKRARLALTLKKMREKKKEKEELKEAVDMVGYHNGLTDMLKNNGKKMKEEEVKQTLGHIANIEGKLGKQAMPKVGYAPWLTVEGTY